MVTSGRLGREGLPCGVPLEPTGNGSFERKAATVRLEHLHHHLSRRNFLTGAAAAGAAAVASGTVFSGVAGAADHKGDDMVPGGELKLGNYDDSFDVGGALSGAWAAATSARYGRDDQRGTLNEITEAKTARALHLIEGAKNVVTANMGHTMVNGFPAYRTFPPRRWQQRFVQLGYTPNQADKFFATTTAGNKGEDEWREADRARGPLGYSQGTTPLGANRLSGNEERFPEGYTFQIATQLDNLNHIGVEHVFYNGFDGREFATPVGATKLGAENIGAFVTRGVLIDILGWKASRGSGDVQSASVNGQTRYMLSNTYRITLEDIESAMKWSGVHHLEPGDVVVIRTGWGDLADDPERYDQFLATEPGIYIREAKYFADHRVAVVASDSWGLEVVGNPVSGPNAFPVHQVLLTQHGVRIGEGVLSTQIADAGVHEFVYMYSPMNAVGATAGGTPPVALYRNPWTK